MTELVIFAPAPVLTVTIEDHPDGPDIHLHAGGQGVWQARMLLRMGVDVAFCCVLTGESGRMLHHLLEDEGVRVVSVGRQGRSAAYVHDRRGGERVPIVETAGEPLSRHDLDELYGVTLREGLAAELTILSGPAGEDTLPPDVYRRLASDLAAGGRRVAVDLAGDRLAAALEGGVSIAKVSDEELLADGRIGENADRSEIAIAMRRIADEGAESVIVTRAHEPLLMLADGVLSEVSTPTMAVADTTGAGDSLTAGVVASVARGMPLSEAITWGAAAGALNVTRHGLGTGDRAAIEELQRLITTRTLDGGSEHAETLSPEQLAQRTVEE